DVPAEQAGPVGGPLAAGKSSLVPDPHLTQPVQFGEPDPEVVREAVRGRFKVARRTHMTHRYPLGTGKTSPMRTDGPRSGEILPIRDASRCAAVVGRQRRPGAAVEAPAPPSAARPPRALVDC